MGKQIIINVGRQFGSGGKSVASELGRMLDIPVYDNELITKAAAESGFSPELFRRSDEHKFLFGMGRRGSAIADEDLFRIQSDTIRHIADSGSAVFVGRASDYVLRDRDCCVAVFVCAPLEARLARVCERMGIGEEEARKLIRSKDKGREEYYNFFTFSNWGVAANYDLCVDSSLLGIEKTAEFIIEFCRMRGLLPEENAQRR